MQEAMTTTEPTPRRSLPPGAPRILIAIGALLLATSARAEIVTAEVVHVADGDTITILDDTKTEHRVRLSGIDAPEKGQPFGDASRKHLSSLVARKVVNVDWYKRDKYGRLVRKVWVASPDSCLDARRDCPRTLDAGLAQITAGLAWHFKKYVSEQAREDRAAYANAESEARGAQRGLWRDPAPLASREYRGREVRP
jgi:endonuclease YncB( thermonuclease family)